MAQTEWEQMGMWLGWMRTDSIYLGGTKWVRGEEALPPSPRCLDVLCYLASCLSHTCNAIGLTNTTAPCLSHVRTTRHNGSAYTCLLGVWQAIGYTRIPTRRAFRACNQHNGLRQHTLALMQCRLPTPRAK